MPTAGLRQGGKPEGIGIMSKSKIPIVAVAVLLLPFGGMAVAEDAPAPAPATPSASGGTTLPSLEVDAPRRTQTPRKPKVRVANRQRREASEVPQQTPTEVLAG